MSEGRECSAVNPLMIIRKKDLIVNQWGSDPASLYWCDEKLWDGEWHHVVVTYDGATRKMYIDTVEVLSLIHI